MPADSFLGMTDMVLRVVGGVGLVVGRRGAPEGAPSRVGPPPTPEL